MTKSTLYDFLEVSPSASHDLIAKAYELKRAELSAMDQSSDEARNKSLFIEEAWSTLSNSQKRASYDERLKNGFTPPPPPPVVASHDTDQYADRSQSIFLEWWDGSKVSKVLVGFAIFLALIFFYHLKTSQENRRLEEKRIELISEKAKQDAAREAERVAQETTRIENARVALERSQQNQQRMLEQQGRLADRSLDFGSRREDRSDRILEVQTQDYKERLKMEKEDRKWSREQYQKRSEQFDGQQQLGRDKAKLCAIYRSNGQPLMAAQEGCR